MTEEPERDRGTEGSGRRRYLTILISDLSDSVSIAGSMEAEDYAALIEKLRHAFERIIPKHGGTIVQILGDGVLACFGYPHPMEDDGRRAAEAALDLHEAVRQQRAPDKLRSGSKTLTMHTGIHSGLVLVNAGDAVSGKIRIFGNAINIAARLAEAAKSGQILVTSETLGAEQHFFETDCGHHIKPAGIQKALSVCRILGRARVFTRFEARIKRGLTPFTGRQGELGQLMSGLQRTYGDELQFFATTAPPGVGKTRLAEEFLSRVDSTCTVLRGYCESYLSAEPLQPFLQMLRSIAGIEYGMPSPAVAEALHRMLAGLDPALLPLAPVLLRALSTAVSQETGDQTGTERSSNIGSAFAALFARLASAKPLVLFIDDWQWADDSSRQVLNAIRPLRHRPIFVLVAARDTASGIFELSHAQILHLEPLSAAETEDAIAHLLPGQSQFVLSTIRDYSGGNPLFVEELCHSASHNVDKDDSRSHGGLAWLDKLIEARVERLPTNQAELVRTAAVIGNVIPLKVLTAITGYNASHPLVRALAEQDLVYPGEQVGTLRFKHGIAREVIYKSVSPRERTALHLQIAEALREQAAAGQEEELYEPLAYHYGAAGEVAEAARYAELAGDKAAAAAALDRAQMQYRAALNALDLVPEHDGKYERWIAISERLAMACIADPSWDSLQVLFQAAKLACARQDDAALMRLLYWLGYTYYSLGEARLAISRLEMALNRKNEGTENRLIMQILAVLGQAYASACDYDKALALAGTAIQSKYQHPRKSARTPVNLPYILACKGTVLADKGQFENAHELFDQAWEMVSGSGHQVEGSILSLRSCVLIWQGRWEEAYGTALEAKRIAERVKSQYLLGMSRALGGYALWKSQRTPDAVQQLACATSWLEKGRRRLFISLNHGWLAECQADQRSWKEARKMASRAIWRSRNLDRLGEAAAYRAMARGSAEGINRRPVSYYLDAALKNAARRQSPHETALTELCEAGIWLGRGDRDKAAHLLDRALSAFDSMAMRWHFDQATALGAKL